MNGLDELCEVRQRRSPKGSALALKLLTSVLAALLLVTLLAELDLPEVLGSFASVAPQFHRPSLEHGAPDEHEAVDSRRLAPFQFDPNLTKMLVFLAAGSPILCNPGTCNRIRGLYAGLEFTSIQLDITGSDYDFNFAFSKMRVVRSTVDTAGAQAGECQASEINTSAQVSTLGGVWVSSDGAVPVQIPPSTQLAQIPALNFKMAGTFRFCYSHAGDFVGDDTDVVQPVMEVYGMYDNRYQCLQDETCLTKRPYRCYLLRDAYNNMHDDYSMTSSCVLDFTYEGAGFLGSAGRVSWSEDFGATYDSNGLVASVTEGTCASAPPADFLCLEGASCFSGKNSVAPNVTADNRQFNLPVGRNDLNGSRFKASTVAACYCVGGYNGLVTGVPACSAYTMFLQQVGVLHFYVSKVCRAGFNAVACETDFTGASPQFGFSIRVECPTDACNATGASRVKIVSQETANDLPSWNPASGCGAAAHGMRDWPGGGSTLALPPDSNPDVATMDGGSRQDYKLWNFWNGNFNADESGFLFVMGSSDHELRSGQNGETFDVCYCDDACDERSNWFKVGQLRYAPFQLVSRAESTSRVQQEYLVEYAMQPGTVGFYRPLIDHGVMGLQEGGTVKLVHDPTMVADDAMCVSADYDTDSLGGLTSLAAAKARYSGTASQDGQRLVFNSGNTGNQITVKRAGFVAICYCAFFDDETGRCDDDHWVFTHHITVRGPGVLPTQPPQVWEFSTHVTFRFEYKGWGLDAGDKVRIITSDQECTDFDGDPSGAYTSTFVKLRCPDPCSEVGDVDAVVNGDISVSLLADYAYGCDINNENCGSNDIKEIVVLDEHTTMVEFENPHTLSDGDYIQIGSPGDNIKCSPTDPDYVCNDERLAVLKGQYRLADDPVQSYAAGHLVSTFSNPNRLTIPVGWPDPKPTFVISYQNSKRGTWIRHSKATTSEEILGTRERLDMKVCWKFAPNVARRLPSKFVSQVGTVSLVDPFPLNDCRVSMTTTVKSQTTPIAPVIVSFRTGAAETGKRYGQVEGTTRLRILFKDALILDPKFGDGGSIVEHAGEDELAEAKQYICGKLFKEMWSSDPEYGFPLPRGCYYQVYGHTREIIILFDARNGLRADKDYQLVISAAVNAGAVKNGEYVEILTMDDTDLFTYRAIERGLATLSHTPEDGAFGDSGVMFANEGFTITGGSDAGTLELGEGTVLSILLRGDSGGGGIKAGSILRVFLWPLTQWDTESICSVTCSDFDVIDAPCGVVQSCKGSAVVAGFQRNFLELKLPADMTTIDETITHSLHFSNMKFPKGGFFQSRLGAEISKSDDTKPHYVQSFGAYLFKQPDEGRSVGKLVNFFGDGNTKPFARDEQNVLFASIVLGATLYSFSQSGDAQMKITLPVGYTCVQPEDVNGFSGWKTQDDLGVFGGQVPQGIGAPDDPDAATRGWFVEDNTCTYKLRQNSAIFAGSSLMVRITANNPQAPLQRDDDANTWEVTLTSKGHSFVSVQFAATSFATVEDDYSNSLAVLGSITHASIMPTNLAITPDAFVPSAGYLRVFFKASQTTGVFSRVHLRAADGFGFNPCLVADLEDSYYASRKGEQTFRLPGILSCEYSTQPYKHVEVNLTGSILAGHRYAFSVYTVNPMQLGPDPLEGWMVYTLSNKGFLIDGTQNVVKFVSPTATTLDWGGSANDSFGMYSMQLNYPGSLTCADVAVSDMLPYSISQRRATVTVSPLCLPQLANTTLRVLAPHGYVWDFTNAEFSGTMPGGVPERDGNVLLWSTPSVYQPAAATTYSFQAMVRVPDVHPTSMANDFIFEFGYNAQTAEGRIAASSVPVPRVRALVNVMLDYDNNMALEDTNLKFQLETVTDIPPGGYLTLTGPEGFAFASACIPMEAPMARGSPYDVDPTAGDVMMLPADVQCQTSAMAGDPVTGAPGYVTIRITAGAGGIIAGRYGFQIAGTSPPASPPPQPDSNKPCGYSCCWDFESKDLLGLHLDAPLSVPCYAINARMAAAGMPVLTEKELQETGRDDRPLMYNPLVFTIVLTEDANYAGVMRIRGPAGVVFQEDCQEDIETEGTKVFGEGTVLSPIYEPWPSYVKIASCRGEGPDAYIHVVPTVEGTVGLARGLAYPFRVAIFKNPETRPTRNLWTIEFNQESSQPFAGFELWTFSGVALHTVSTARSTSTMGEAKFANPVTITFAPSNRLIGPGFKIVVGAPEFFQFAHELYTCRIMIQPIGNSTTYVDGVPQPNFIGPPALIWGDGESACHVDPMTLRTLTVTVKSDRTMEVNTDYQITVFVHNPPFVMDTIGSWTLQTHQSPDHSGVLATFRDRVTIPGYVVLDRPTQWMYLNSGDIRGRSRVLSLYFEVAFPFNLEYGDEITVQAPQGFTFEEDGSPGSCRNFVWDPNTVAGNKMPNSDITCTGGLIRFSVMEPQNIKENVLMKFRIDTLNPVETPHVMENNWIVSQLEQGTKIISTEALESWTIVSQLDQVDIQLVGENKAAGTLSTIAVSFLPVSTADELELQALAPNYISFTGAVATSTGHEVIATSGNSIRVQAAIQEEVPILIVIDLMTLGTPGGQTVFNLVTKLNNGDQMDESKNFAQGFVQPGLLTVKSRGIMSRFNMDPVTYPIASLWETRMLETALASFVIQNTMQTEAGHVIYISSVSEVSAEYEMRPEDFSVTHVASGFQIPFYNVSAIGNVLTAVLAVPLLAVTDYRVGLTLVAPAVPRATDSNFRIELYADYNTSSQQLLNTNDGTTYAFMLSDVIDLEVRALSDSPPTAIVIARLSIDPKATLPSELVIVAPLGFNFTDDCLVQGGFNGEITACMRQGDLEGRATAKLTCQPGGMKEYTSGIYINTLTPTRSAEVPSWYISALNSEGLQVGWGEDQEGFPVKQMLGSKVVYSGVPDRTGWMVFGFVTQRQVPAGGKILVGHPSSFIIQCNGAFLNQLRLRGNYECTSGLGFFELKFDFPMTIGQQAFAVTSTPPDAVTEANVFFIKVLDQSGAVLDAAMDIPGLPIQHGLPMTALELVWSNSEPAERSTVSLGFELHEELPAQDPPALSEVVVQMPPDFAQQVTSALHVEWLEKALPYAPGEWIDEDSPDRLNIFLDVVAAETLEPGFYRFSFPVLVPAIIPAYNVFVVTLCGPKEPNSTVGSCSGWQDPRAIVSFPVVSFSLGDEHPDALKYSTASGVLRRVSLSVAPLFLAALFLAVLT